MFYTYLHCKPNGEPFYVGKGTWKRVVNFYQRTAHHKNVVAKYGRENIGVFAFPCASEDQALADEIAHIEQLRAEGYDLVNLTVGGGGIAGYEHSENARKKIGAASKGNKHALGFKHSAASKARMVAGRANTKLSEETRARISAALQERNRSTRRTPTEYKVIAKLVRLDARLTKIEDGHKRTFTMTEAHREALRKANTGKKQSPETLAKLSAIRKGRVATPETRAKLSSIQLARTDRKPITPEHREKIAASRRGKKQGPHSPEHRAAIAAAHLGKKRGPLSEEHRQKIAAGNTGKRMSPEATAKAWETRRRNAALKEI